MKISQQVVIKRWKPILEEYEKIKNKVSPRPFRLVKDLCLAHHISNKELRRYYRKWQEEKNRMIPYFLPKEGLVQDPVEPLKR